MSPPTPLPITLAPIDGEGLGGFVLRLARLTVRGTPTAFFRDFCDMPATQPFRPWERRAITTLAPRLAPFAECSADALVDRWQVLRETHHAVNPHRIIENGELPRPKLCTSCLTEESFLPYSWQLAHTTHCARHETVLKTACPACGAAFTWHSLILSQCPRCDVAWRDLDKDRDDEGNICESVLEPSPDDVDRLYRAYLHCASPHALLLWGSEHFPEEATTVTRRMLAAQAVVFTDAGNQHLREQASRALQTHVPAWEGLREDVDGRIVALRSDRTLAVDLAPLVGPDIPASNRIFPKRMRTISLRAESLPFVVESGPCSNLLGLRGDASAQLADLGVFEPLNPLSRADLRLFDMEVVYQTMADWHARQTGPLPEDAIDLDEAARLGRLWRLSRCDIIKAAHDGLVRHHLGDSLDFTPEVFCVSRSDVIAHGQEAFEANPEETLLRVNILRMLDISERILAALCREGLLQSARRAAPGEVVTHGAITTLLQHVRFAKREAALNGTSVEEAWDRILADGAKPLDLPRNKGGGERRVAVSSDWFDQPKRSWRDLAA
ncbi:TniQ family protein [Methylonatrum kenyense]|uniref:TniQ family protein n=1 Tax=Methylonatrum kenyense TaxID=455253 RepID=UPI0020BE518A|nr:TniQ family protein [Methylonatrum kenyense]MCK8515861.1 TniQ family protein [Methylonatrum kenyense]